MQLNKGLAIPFWQKHISPSVLLLLVAIASRLVVLPFSQVMESDATSRMLIAEHAVKNGGELSSLQWPALHINFLSAAQIIFGHRVWGPVILSLLLGAFSVVPFYRFTKNIYNATGAFYAALVFTFSPLVFRLSFVPLSEIYHVFFCISALWFISEGVTSQQKKIKWAILAGLSATIAAGGRFEAWVLIGLLGLILLALKEWKMAFLFGAAAAIYPVCWMVYCYKTTGNALQSLFLVEQYNFDIAKMNENLDGKEKARRLIFFPLSWAVCLFPLVSIISILVLCRKILTKNISFRQVLFSFLFFFFITFFIYEAKTGSLATQHRYTITLFTFSIPFYALWFANEKKLKLKKRLTFLFLLLSVPWAYCWSNLPWHKLFFKYENGQKAIANIAANTAWEAYPVPKFENPAIERLNKLINKYSFQNDGFFIDWLGWCESYYFSQQSKLDANSVFIVPNMGAKEANDDWLKTFFTNKRNGIILLKDFSNFSQRSILHGNVLEIKDADFFLLLHPLHKENHLRLFKYHLLTDVEKLRFKNKKQHPPKIFTPIKNVEYYMEANFNDPDWLSGSWKDAVEAHCSIKTQVWKSAVWLVEQDLNKLKEGKLPY